MQTFQYATKDFAVKEDRPSEFVFEGYGAVFGTEDRGGDVVERGAFKETIRDNDGRFPLVRDHELTLKDRLGVAFPTPDRQGVRLKAHVNTETRAGREAKSDILHAERHGLPIGLSFGYKVRDSDRKGGTRHLKDLKVFEWSVTQVPMNPDAEITDTKKCRAGGCTAELTKEIRDLTEKIRRNR